MRDDGNGMRIPVNRVGARGLLFALDRIGFRVPIARQIHAIVIRQNAAHELPAAHVDVLLYSFIYQNHELRIGALTLH